MAKIFDRQLEDQRIRRLNEDAFFRLHQKELLWLANTNEGRDFFCIDKKFPFIHEIAKNFIRHHELVPEGKLWRRVTTSEFRVGSKYANIIRSRWEAWLDFMADYAVLLSLAKIPKCFAPDYAFVGGRLAGVFRVVDTFFPDPDPETTSVDGRFYASGTDSWQARHDAATSDAAPDAESSAQSLYAQDNTTAPSFQINRAMYLFDTSSLPDTDNITAAIFSVDGDPGADDSLNQDIHLCSSTPASNTALVVGDYNKVGTTSFGSLDQANWSTTAYNDITLNATGLLDISKTGISKFALRYSSDINNARPGPSTLFSFVTSAFAETAGTGADPKLAVTHAAAAAAAIPAMLLLGV